MVRLISAALLSIGVVQAVAAQSLGDVARKEEERRKAVKSSGKVYTNDELQPVPQPSAPPAASGDRAATAAPSPGSGTSSSQAAASDKASAKDDEKTWRKRMADARDALERSKTFANALQNQLNSLVTDFVNRDDPGPAVRHRQPARQSDGRTRACQERDRLADESDRRHPGRSPTSRRSGRLGSLRTLVIVDLEIFDWLLIGDCPLLIDSLVTSIRTD